MTGGVGERTRLAWRICANEAQAGDVAQEAFVAVRRGPGPFDPRRGGFGTSLLTLVHHEAVDAVRRETAGAAAPRTPRKELKLRC
jgi:DNA-directed RNA polymerase specialized sigma24 family protein